MLLFLVNGGAGVVPSRWEGCDLRGPLSDFWPKVVRDWSRRIPGLNWGPSQTAMWVSLVYGQMDPSDGGEGWERFIRRWGGVQEWNWARSETWKRPYSRAAKGGESRLALRQHLILAGTISSNPYLVKSLERVGIRAEPSSFEISGRRYEGEDLVLVALGPSPFAEGKYALSIASIQPRALRVLQELPFGETDYILFRGRHAVESGFFEKPNCRRWKPARSPSLSPDHRGWTTLETTHFLFRFDPSRSPWERVKALSLREERALGEVRSSLRLPDGGERIIVFLYASSDEKFRETGDGGPVHLDAGSYAQHRLQGDEPEPYLSAMVLLLRQLGAAGSSMLRLSLSLATSGSFEGRPLADWAARLLETEPRVDWEALFDISEDRLDKDLKQGLAAASFVRFLMEEGRLGSLKQLYRNSREGAVAAHFRDLMGESLSHAAQRWSRSIREGEAAPRSGSEPPPAPVTDDETIQGPLGQARALFLQRQDAEARREIERILGIAPGLAEAHLLLARLAFRNGDSDTAEREAAAALSLNPRDAALLSWAHVTRGRAEAMRGHLSVAALELRDPALARGPEGPRLLADLWLESLGLSPNRKVVEEQLRQEARADLQNFDWDGAEKKILAILSANPHNPEAHFQLSQVYLSKHNTWMERAQLVNELHPSTSLLDPEFYNFLADRADLEMRKGMALALPDYAAERAEGDPYQVDAARLMKKSDLYDPSLRMEGDSPLEYHPHFFRGRALFFASDWARAGEELRLSLSFDGGHQRIVAWDLVYLGFVDHFTGDVRSACAHFEAARRLKMGGKPAAAARKGIALAGGCKGEESAR